MITEVPIPGPPEDDDERARRFAEAARLHDYLAGQGATFRIDADGDLQTDLNGMRSITNCEQADAIARAVITLAAETGRCCISVPWSRTDDRSRARAAAARPSRDRLGPAGARASAGPSAHGAARPRLVKNERTA